MPEVTIPGLTNGQLYGFRIFPRNVKNQYQTIVPGGGVTCTPTDDIYVFRDGAFSSDEYSIAYHFIGTDNVTISGSTSMASYTPVLTNNELDFTCGYTSGESSRQELFVSSSYIDITDFSALEATYYMYYNSRTSDNNRAYFGIALLSNDPSSSDPGGTWTTGGTTKAYGTSLNVPITATYDISSLSGARRIGFCNSYNPYSSSTSRGYSYWRVKQLILKR